MTQNLKKTRNYFRYKLGFKDKTINKVFNRYKYDMRINADVEAGDKIQADWNEFMKWWGTVKDNFKDSYFKKEKRLDYDDWWQQSNMDGSFAYNNAADDF